MLVSTSIAVTPSSIADIHTITSIGPMVETGGMLSRKKAKCCRTGFVIRKMFPYKMWDSTKWYMYTYGNLIKTYLNK